MSSVRPLHLEAGVLLELALSRSHDFLLEWSSGLLFFAK